MVEPDILLAPSAIPSVDLKGQDVILALEVSDASRKYDLGSKAPLYARHGVAHYWVVDLVDQKLIHHSSPSGEEYTVVTPDSWDVAAPLPFEPEISLRLSDLL